MKNILLHPRNEWRIIKDEQTAYRNIMSYAAVIGAIPPACAIAGSLIFDRGGAAGAVHTPIRYVLAANILWYFMIIVNVIITGAVITAVATRKEPGWIGLRGLKLAVYSFTPLFLVCIPVIIPELNWLIYGAMLYSIYLLYLGILSMTEAGQGRSAWYATTSFFTAGIIVGTLNMFEYMFESYLVKILILPFKGWA